MRIRLRRPADSATVVLRREAVTDPRLTLTAVGVLALLAAVPDERPVTIAELLYRTGEDPTVVQAALDALEAAGYLQLDPDIGADGEAYLSDRPAASALHAPAAAPPMTQAHPPGPMATPLPPASPTPAPSRAVRGPEPPAVADEATRRLALERIRRTLSSTRSEQARQQAQAEAALRERLAAAAQVRRQAAAARAHAAAETPPPVQPPGQPPVVDPDSGGQPDSAGGTPPAPGSP